MSRSGRPAARRSRAVYRRRRLAALVVLLAVVVVAALVLVRPWRHGTGAQDAPAPAPSAAPASPPASATPTPTPSASAAHKDGDACVAADITVEAITDATAYGAGRDPKLSLSVTNTGSTSCTIDVGTATQRYTVTSGKDVYWRSSDCQTKASHKEILLKEHQTLTSEPIVWDRTRSDPSTCSKKERPAAPAGGASYHLSVSIGGFSSEESAQFLLR